MRICAWLLAFTATTAMLLGSETTNLVEILRRFQAELDAREGRTPEAVQPPVGTQLSQRPSDARGPALPAEYRLRAGDRVKVEVADEPGMSVDEREVAADGTVRLPIVGPVSVSGKTVEEATRGIHEILERDYLVNPRVRVERLGASLREGQASPEPPEPPPPAAVAPKPPPAVDLEFAAAPPTYKAPVLPPTDPKPAVTLLIPEEPVVLPPTDSKPAVAPLIPEEPVVLPPTDSKPAVAPLIPEEPVVLPPTDSKPAVAPLISEEPVMLPPTDSKPVVTPLIPEEPVVLPPTDSKPAVAPSTYLEPTVLLPTGPEPAVGPSNLAEPVSTGVFFIVTNQVAKPGNYPWTDEGVTLRSALDLAGGPTAQADMRRVTVRRLVDGERRELEVNLEQPDVAWRGGALLLKPGDVVEVPAKK
jgi:protein involved in polysaccharide export with SLBB domain